MIEDSLRWLRNDEAILFKRENGKLLSLIVNTKSGDNIQFNYSKSDIQSFADALSQLRCHIWNQMTKDEVIKDIRDAIRERLMEDGE